MNELGREKSPYLLQHAKNPVHWKSWSKASLQLALTSNKPILVSIGYATCHWCHVMEKECFEDQAVADLLNQSFVCIKVDREEMPDVDDVYMTSLHLFGQRGGWPLNVFLTPDQLPFYGGTYFPKPQFLQVLRHISNTWSNESDRAKEIGIQIQSVLAEHNDVRSKGVANVERWLELSYKRSVQEFDDDFGGFGGAPKFPPYQQLPALLRFFNCTGELKALEMCETTLLQMFAGGIYDHIGGGFSRYAVDESWTVPHFEKMLYTNALLGPIYLSFYKFGQDETFLRCAQETAEYMMRDLLLEGGGFASGEDADSEGEEGRFYVFSIEELGLILGDDFEKWSSVFDFDVNGNFEGKIIFRLKNQSWTDRISQSWTEVQNRVRNFRDQRMRPLRDHKILTGWNALAIKFLVELYRVDRKKRNLEVAQKTGQFLLDNLKINDVVMRRVCDGEVSHRGLLEDYSYLISAFIDLYLATGDEIWLKESIRIQQKQDELFWDDTSGGYFTTESDSGLIVRLKSHTDDALPSGNGVSALNLLKLHSLLGDEGYFDKAKSTIGLIENDPSLHPNAAGMMLEAIDSFTRGLKTVVVVDDVDAYFTLSSSYSPNALVLNRSSLKQDSIGIGVSKNQRGFYLCEGQVCKAPTEDIKSAQRFVAKT